MAVVQSDPPVSIVCDSQFIIYQHSPKIIESVLAKYMNTSSGLKKKKKR